MSYMTEALLRIMNCIMVLVGVVFSAIAIKYWGVTPGGVIWMGLVFIAVLLVWLIIEARKP